MSINYGFVIIAILTGFFLNLAAAVTYDQIKNRSPGIYKIYALAILVFTTLLIALLFYTYRKWYKKPLDKLEKDIEN